MSIFCIVRHLLFQVKYFIIRHPYANNADFMVEKVWVCENNCTAFMAVVGVCVGAWLGRFYLANNTNNNLASTSRDLTDSRSLLTFSHADEME